MTNQPKPKTTFAISGNREVHLVPVECPHCHEYHLQASDIEVRPEGVFGICSKCHHDVLKVTRL